MKYQQIEREKWILDLYAYWVGYLSSAYLVFYLEPGKVENQIVGVFEVVFVLFSGFYFFCYYCGWLIGRLMSNALQ